MSSYHAAVLSVLAASVFSPAAQPADLERVLTLTSQYLVAYEMDLTAVVAEEQYEQWVDAGRDSAATSTGRMRGRPAEQGPTKRSLVSEFLMIRWPGEAAWFGFRDVLSVDGRPVRDREQRLLRLFREGPKDLLTRADLIAAESSRYNIGSVARNINVPTQALDFLHPRHRSRFQFRKSSEETLEGTTTWKVEFEERERPYLIGTPSRRRVQARGFAWIDPLDGAVLQTQLNLSLAKSRQVLRTRITVTFRHDQALGLRVPTELQETHEQSDPASRLGGDRGRPRALSQFQTIRNGDEGRARQVIRNAAGVPQEEIGLWLDPRSTPFRPLSVRPCVQDDDN